MVYLVTFLEGLITFISLVCSPMLPIYLSYFCRRTAGCLPGTGAENALGFVLGFTLLFVAMGAFCRLHRRAAHPAPAGGKHRQRSDCHLLRPQLPGCVPPVPVPGLKGYSVGHDMGFFSALIFGAVLPWAGPPA